MSRVCEPPRARTRRRRVMRDGAEWDPSSPGGCRAEVGVCAAQMPRALGEIHREFTGSRRRAAVGARETLELLGRRALTFLGGS
jgi:hypothetical protein